MWTDTENFIEIKLEPFQLFDLHISGQGHSNKWIAGYLDVSSTYISKIRLGERKLTEKMRKKLNELFETDF